MCRSTTMAGVSLGGVLSVGYCIYGTFDPLLRHRRRTAPDEQPKITWKELHGHDLQAPLRIPSRSTRSNTTVTQHPDRQTARTLHRNRATAPGKGTRRLPSIHRSRTTSSSTSRRRNIPSGLVRPRTTNRSLSHAVAQLHSPRQLATHTREY